MPEEIRQGREKLGLTQKRLAHLLGVASPASAKLLQEDFQRSV